MDIACRSTRNAARIKRFLSLHIVIKQLTKNKHDQSFIMLQRNSFEISLQIWHLSNKLEPAGRIGDFGNFWSRFAKSPRVL